MLLKLSISSQDLNSSMYLFESDPDDSFKGKWGCPSTYAESIGTEDFFINFKEFIYSFNFASLKS